MKIQKAKNLENPTSFETKHLPWILVPEFIKKGEEFEIMVKIGKAHHPMIDEHYIRGIQVYVNDKCVKKVLLDLTDKPETKFKISFDRDSKIVARAECNVHGIWESEVDVILYRGDDL